MQLIDLSPHYGLISISGEDNAKFLQGQLTCDIREVTEIESRFGAFCNHKGRIKALFHIFLRADIYYLQLPKGLLTQTLISLKKYAMFSKVKLQDSNAEFLSIGIIQDDHKIIRAIEKNNMPKMNSLESHFKMWNLLNIRAGIPEIWPEISEMFLPHDLNLPKLGAVSFSKGCYCGQEIIARMEYRAKIKRQLSHIVIPNTNTLPLPGTELFAAADSNSEASLGTLVTASCGENNDIECLVVTKISV